MTIKELIGNREEIRFYSNWPGPGIEVSCGYMFQDFDDEIECVNRLVGWPDPYAAKIQGVTWAVGVSEEEAEKFAGVTN